MNKENKTVKIFTLEKEQEYLIPLIQETFDKENISFRVKSKYDSAYDGIFVGQKGVGDIYVFENDKERAEVILNDILNDKED
jgi:hypothetical protein